MKHSLILSTQVCALAVPFAVQAQTKATAAEVKPAAQASGGSDGDWKTF